MHISTFMVGMIRLAQDGLRVAKPRQCGRFSPGASAIRAVTLVIDSVAKGFFWEHFDKRNFNRNKA